MTNNPIVQINLFLNRLKSKNGDSNDSLGKVLGLSHAHVSRKLNGKYSWTMEEIAKLADYYGYDSMFDLVFAARSAKEEGTSDARDGVVLNYASKAEAKRRLSRYQRNERGEIIRPDRAAAYKGDPRAKEFMKDQDEPA